MGERMDVQLAEELLDVPRLADPQPVKAVIRIETSSPGTSTPSLAT
jgi:hypothetical protein